MEVLDSTKNNQKGKLSWIFGYWCCRPSRWVW